MMPSPLEDAPDDRHGLFVQLLNASHRRLLGYLVSLLGNRHDAEDVLQRASVTLWRRFETFTPGTDFLAWASTVAFYEAKNFQRMAARSRLQFNDSLLQILAAERVADLAHAEARLDALEVCVQKLDKTGRRLIEAAYFEGADIVSLAAQLGRAPQTLYNKLNLIRRALAECVERRMAEGAKA
jgi:RNA polymerase sigma-70 factor (ECF subfamily)